MSDRTKIHKIIILGDGAVGKTTLRKRYFGDTFESSYSMTIGADFAVKNETINDQHYVLQIWDLAGQPRFKEVRSSFYQKAAGMILLYDISVPSSFEHLPMWIQEFSENIDTDIRDLPIILVGNKVDLRGEPGLNIVTSNEGVSYAQELTEWSNHEIPFVETSALVGLNVEVPFKKLIMNLEKSLSEN